MVFKKFFWHELIMVFFLSERKVLVIRTTYFYERDRISSFSLFKCWHKNNYTYLDHSLSLYILLSHSIRSFLKAVNKKLCLKFIFYMKNHFFHRWKSGSKSMTLLAVTSILYSVYESCGDWEVAFKKYVFFGKNWIFKNWSWCRWKELIYNNRKFSEKLQTFRYVPVRNIRGPEEKNLYGRRLHACIHDYEKRLLMELNQRL